MANQDTNETKRPVVLLPAGLERPGRYAGLARLFQFAQRELSVCWLIPQPARALRAWNRYRRLPGRPPKQSPPPEGYRSGLPKALSIEPAAASQERPKPFRRSIFVYL